MVMKLFSRISLLFTAQRKMSQFSHRGALIVLEGGDKSGKTTHSRKLLETLRKEEKRAEVIRFPARETLIGRLIDEYLSVQEELEDHAVHLLFAANRWEMMSEMTQKLKEGINLIVDRYSYSGVAYSVAKQIEGLDLEWCWQSEVGLLCPDAVILLSVDMDTVAKRQSLTLERFEENSFQERVQMIFRQMKTSAWTEIDTSREINEVHRDIKKIVDRVMQNLDPAIKFLC